METFLSCWREFGESSNKIWSIFKWRHGKMDGMMMDVEKMLPEEKWIWIWNFFEKRGFLGNGKLDEFWGSKIPIRRDDGEWWWMWKNVIFLYEKPGSEKMRFSDVGKLSWTWKMVAFGSRKTCWSSDQKIPAKQLFQIDLDRSRSSKHRRLITPAPSRLPS